MTRLGKQRAVSSRLQQALSDRRVQEGAARIDDAFEAFYAPLSPRAAARLAARKRSVSLPELPREAPRGGGADSW